MTATLNYRRYIFTVWLLIRPYIINPIYCLLYTFVTIHILHVRLHYHKRNIKFVITNNELIWMRDTNLHVSSPFSDLTCAVYQWLHIVHYFILFRICKCIIYGCTQFGFETVIKNIKFCIIRSCYNFFFKFWFDIINTIATPVHPKM